jgi:hypothetical protein
MIKKIWQNLGLFQRAEFLSVRDLLQRAGAIGGVFLVLHLAGFREFTGVLNGTIGSLTLGWNLSAFLAIIYILFYLAFVILVPVLVLAAFILKIWQQYIRKVENPLTTPDANF